ncbi:MAG: glycosyltransferase family 2 protein [Chloroflexi bacterium]|nr:glycosyltransferase family 2 protein [Chloroflexota bacterium]
MNVTVARISSVSAVFPAYNDGGTIASMVTAALIALRQVTDDYEIIVTNDGSRDYTVQVLDELAIRYPELKVIHHPYNQGYGAALRTGFAAATKDWVFYTDGDAQYNPLELVDLVGALRPGVDMVNGYKLARHDSWLRILIGKAYHQLVAILFGIRIRDVDCDFRLIPRRVLEEIKLESVSGAVCLELVKKIQDAGYVFAEVPVHHYSRKYGTSQFFNPWRIIRTFYQLWQLYKQLVLKRERRTHSQ